MAVKVHRTAFLLLPAAFLFMLHYCGGSSEYLNLKQVLPKNEPAVLASNASAVPNPILPPAVKQATTPPVANQRLPDSVSYQRPATAPLVYSAHNCIGNLGGGSPGDARCHFKNVCVKLLPYINPDSNGDQSRSAIKLLYYRPEQARGTPVHWGEKYMWKGVWARLGSASAVVPKFVFKPIASSAWWSPDKDTILTEAFWPLNYGHALGDDYFPAFRLAKQFNVWSRKLALLWHLSCHHRGRDGEIKAGCDHHDELSEQLLDRPIMWEESPLWPKDGSPVCFENLYVGTQFLRMGYPSEGIWPQFIAEFKKNAKVPVDYRPVKQKIVIFYKNGRRTVTNYEEMRDRLVERFEIDVEIYEPAIYTMTEQIAHLKDATLVITPCGGVSFSAMLLSKGASAIFIDYWDTHNQASTSMEKHLFNYQNDVTTFFYPVKFAEVGYDINEVWGDFRDEAHEWLRYRDYANTTVNLDRMEQFAFGGLLQAEASFGLTKSFRHTPKNPPGKDVNTEDDLETEEGGEEEEV